jgi:hypothetical protein
VYVLPKHLDEKVARLHLSKIGVELDELSTEQAIILAYQRLDHSSQNITGTKICHPERSEGLKPRIIRGFFILCNQQQCYY